jgi:hypothetical protein
VILYYHHVQYSTILRAAKKTIISPYSINWLIFIIETECVYCAVRATYLNTIRVNLGLYRATIQAVSRRPVTAKARVLSQVTSMRFGFDKVALGQDFLSSTSVFSCHYHSTNAPHSSSSTCRSYWKDKRTKTGYLLKNVSETGKHLI